MALPSSWDIARHRAGRLVPLTLAGALVLLLGGLLWLVRDSSLDTYRAEVAHEAAEARKTIENRLSASMHHLEIVAAWLGDTGFDNASMIQQFILFRKRHSEIEDLRFESEKALPPAQQPIGSFRQAPDGRWLLHLDLPVRGPYASGWLRVDYDIGRLLDVTLPNATSRQFQVSLLRPGGESLAVMGGTGAPTPVAAAVEARLFGQAVSAEVAFTGPVTPNASIVGLAALAGLFAMLLGYGMLRLMQTVARLQKTQEELKLNEARAWQAQQQLAVALETMGEGFILWDARDRLALCNSRVREMMPALADLLVAGTPFSDFANAAAARRVYQAIEGLDGESPPGGRTTSGEIQLADGRWLSLAEATTPNGEVVALYSDVTLSRRWHAALTALVNAAAAGEDVIAAAVRAIGLGTGGHAAAFARLDADGARFRIVARWVDGELSVIDDPQPLALADYPCSLVVQSRDYRIVRGGLAERFPRAELFGCDAYEGAPVFDGAGCVVGTLFALSRANISAGHDNQPLLRLVGSWASAEHQRGEALTALTEAMAQAQRREEALRESELRFRSVTQSASDAIVTVDDRGTIISWNSGAETIFGWREAEVVGESVNGLIPQAWREPHERIFAELRTGSRELPRGAREVTGIRKDGSAMPMELSVSSWFSGKARFFTGILRDVTSRKQAEDELRQSRELLAAARQQLLDAIESISEGFAVWSKDGHLILSNSRYGQLFGDLNMLLRPGWDILVFTRTLDELGMLDAKRAGGDWVGRRLTHHENCNGPFDIVLADGRWLRSSKHRTLEGSIVETVADITEMKHREEALRRETVILEQMSDAVVVTDLQGIVREWSPAAERTFGYRRDEIVSRPVTRIQRPDQALEFNRMIVKALHTEGRFWSGEIPFVRKDGSEGVCEASIVPLKDSDGKMVATIAVNRDVTDRKRAERQLQKLYTAVEQSASTIVITDAGGLIEYVNRRFCCITGYEPHEVIGRTPRLLKSGATGRETYQQLWHEILDGREWRGEFHNRKKDGSFYWVSTTITPVTDARGRITNLIGIGEDITDKKLAEQKLHQAQKMEAVGQLTGGIAHDFNNLLTVVLGNLELLQDRATMEPRVQRPIHSAIKAARKGAELTQRLLAFSRKQPLSPRVVDLNRLVMGMTELLRRTLGENIEIETFTDPELWTTAVDPNQLENAVLNLSLNARDAMPDGGLLTVTTQNAGLHDGQGQPFPDMRPGDYVVLAVTDTGTGIAKEHLERVFEPFFTTKEIGKGSGLGLSMVYGFTRQSGGTVRLYSEVGKGTTVKLYLPRSDVPEPEDAAPASVTLAQYRGSEAILVVEDDNDVRQFAASFLRELGYTVHEACDAVEADEVLSSTAAVDLVFSDVVLPGGIGGMQVVEATRHWRPAARVLLTSGYAQGAMSRNGTVDPVTPLLQKPYSREELARKVREVLA